MGDSELRSSERETEDKRNITEIRYLCNLLLQADHDSTGTTKLVLGESTDGKSEKALTENMGEKEIYRGEKQT